MNVSMVAHLLFSVESSVTALLAWANPIPAVRKGGNRGPVGVFKQELEHSSCQMTAWRVWKDKSSFLFLKSLKLEVVEATEKKKKKTKTEREDGSSFEPQPWGKRGTRYSSWIGWVLSG